MTQEQQQEDSRWLPQQSRSWLNSMLGHHALDYIPPVPKEQTLLVSLPGHEGDNILVHGSAVLHGMILIGLHGPVWMSATVLQSLHPTSLYLIPWLRAISRETVGLPPLKQGQDAPLIALPGQIGHYQKGSDIPYGEVLLGAGGKTYVKDAKLKAQLCDHLYYQIVTNCRNEHQQEAVITPALLVGDYPHLGSYETTWEEL